MAEHACDVLIIGAGPGGLASAIAARSGGATVVVVDAAATPGGQIWRSSVSAGSAADARVYLDRADAVGVRFAFERRVVAAAGSDSLLVETAEGAERWRYRRLILACGARELLLPFPGWTLPGVSGAGGLQALIKGGWPVQGERIVVAGSGPLLLAAAATAHAAQARIGLVAEDAPWGRVARFALGLWRHPSKLLQAMQLRQQLSAIDYRPGTRVLAALGGSHVEGVRLARGGREFEVACTQLAVGYGLVPNSELGALLGCALRRDGAQAAIAVDARMQTDRQHVYAVGECTGIGGVDAALAEGRIAGYAAVDRDDLARAGVPARVKARRYAERVARAFAPAPDLDQRIRADTLVCRCEDVPWQALHAHADWRAAKLDSRCGMGHCQGRICGAALAQLRGWPAPAPRPPLQPARLGTWLHPSQTSADTERP